MNFSFLVLPHVRYGAAPAVGISRAGTCLSDAISLLEPLTSDTVDFVCQGALITLEMVMVQMNGASDSRGATFRYSTTISYFSVSFYVRPTFNVFLLFY